MSDDGTGGGIRIPSMIVSKDDGRKLIDFLQRSSENEVKKIAVIAMFELDKPDNRVEDDYFYTSSNDRALDFIKYFYEDMVKFDPKDVVFTPKFVTWSCTSCDSDFKKKECVSDG